MANETWKFVQAKSKQAMKQVLGIRDEKAHMKVTPPLAVAPITQEDDMRVISGTLNHVFLCINIWGKHTSRCRSTSRGSAKCPPVTGGHFELLFSSDRHRHREVCLPQIFIAINVTVVV